MRACNASWQRGFLPYAAGGLLGLPLEGLAPYARAAELTHSASLAHDDVIDTAMKRRNRPTLNAVASNTRAVLAGDLLLARVMVELSARGQLEIIQDLSRAVEDLVSGEWLQLEAKNVVDIERRQLEETARLKTASLIGWCVVTPARLAAAPPEVLRAAASFGEGLGLAFQMVDDVLDFEPAGEKPFANDVRNGLVNFVVLELLEEHPRLTAPLRKILGQPEIERFPWEPPELDRARAQVRRRAKSKLIAAREQLRVAADWRGGGPAEYRDAFDFIIARLGERSA